MVNDICAYITCLADCVSEKKSSREGYASTREMVKPAERFTWAGLGIFLRGDNTLVSQGWGENGQCMLKMNCSTEEISVVMTNCDPGVDQAASGVEELVNRNLSKEKERDNP